jgi:hypothetical protein
MPALHPFTLMIGNWSGSAENSQELLAGSSLFLVAVRLAYVPGEGVLGAGLG